MTFSIFSWRARVEAVVADGVVPRTPQERSIVRDGAGGRSPKRCGDASGRPTRNRARPTAVPPRPSTSRPRFSSQLRVVCELRHVSSSRRRDCAVSQRATYKKMKKSLLSPDSCLLTPPLSTGLSLSAPYIVAVGGSEAGEGSVASDEGPSPLGLYM